jgi:hypothetical protein
MRHYSFDLLILYRLYPEEEVMEPTIGIEPMNLFLTKEALYRLSYVGIWAILYRFRRKASCLLSCSSRGLERETRLELATFSLEG